MRSLSATVHRFINWPSPALLVSVFVVTSTMTWVLTNPPTAAFDEPQHYTKAIGVATGQIPGGPVSNLKVRSDNQPITDQWLRSLATTISLPPGKDISSVDCYQGAPADGGMCLAPENPSPPASLVTTYVGRYEPFLYFVPGFLALPGGDPVSSLILGRIGAALLCLALLSLAARYYLRGHNLANYVALLLSLTPMVLFVASELSASGTEVTGSIALTCGLLCLGREDCPRSVWFLIGLSSAAVALSRPTGPLWVVLIFALTAFYNGIGNTWRTLNANRFNALLTGILATLSVLATAIWELTVAPHPPLHGVSFSGEFGNLIRHLPTLGRNLVSGFSLTRIPPHYVQYSWLVLALILLGLALKVGSRRQWTTLLVVCAAAGMATVSLALLVIYPLAQNLQGHYLLPIFLVVPLMAGETLRRNWDRARGLPVVLFASVTAILCATVQFWALRTNWNAYWKAPSYTSVDYYHLPLFWNGASMVFCALMLWGVFVCLRRDQGPAIA
jgi:hypothetical protein